MNMRKSETYRSEIKSYIVRTGMTMTEAVELADALEYDIVWEKRKDVE